MQQSQIGERGETMVSSSASLMQSSMPTMLTSTTTSNPTRKRGREPVSRLFLPPGGETRPCFPRCDKKRVGRAPEVAALVPSQRGRGVNDFWLKG